MKKDACAGVLKTTKKDNEPLYLVESGFVFFRLIGCEPV
jgi:hypothetical protein